MMIKLYPPYIEGTIPAFYGNIITIPYVMNKTVGYKDITGFLLKINNISTNKTLIILDKDNGYDINLNEVYFKIPDKLLTIGQFYKVQLAYKDINGDSGLYSTVGVVKYTDEPAITISNLTAGEINLHQYEYYGKYTPSNLDPTEKEYAYQFDVFDINDNLYHTTGKLIHNASLEDGDVFNLDDLLEDGKIFFIQYTVWTLNKLKIVSRKYRITKRTSVDSQYNIELFIENKFEDGYIDVMLKDPNDTPIYVNGVFDVLRMSSEDNFSTQKEIHNFELRNELVDNKIIFKDFTIQQGIEYIYLIEQYNDDGLHSNPIYSNKIRADFEDMFLYDGERQLKIRFNPKMTSFKVDVLEQKIDTIGSKYPFVFRNGSVYYHEFPVSGLISYWSDDNNLFLTPDEYGIEGDITKITRFATKAEAIEDDKYLDYLDKRKNDQHKKELEYLDDDACAKTLNLTGANIAAERRFKVAVLDWLTNGKAKLFKSPTEGNFLVRLLNSSLTPLEQVGRMLHTFNSTAYEVAECNYKNLLYYGILKNELADRTQLQWETIELVKSENGQIIYTHGKINKYPAVNVQFRDMMPGSVVYIDDKPMTIGYRGYLYVELDHTIKNIVIPEDENYRGYITYSYYGKGKNVFNFYKNIRLLDVPGYQLIGSNELTDRNGLIDIIKYIENDKNKIVAFYQLHFIKQLDASYENSYVYINDNPINLYDMKHFELNDFTNIQSLKMSSGVICECSYQLKIIDYMIEENDLDVLAAKNMYQRELNEYLKYLQEYSEYLKPLEDMLLKSQYIEKIKIDKKYNLENLRVSIEKELQSLFNNDFYHLIDFYEAEDYINNKVEPWEETLNRLKNIIEIFKEDIKKSTNETEKELIQKEIDYYYNNDGENNGSLILQNIYNEDVNREKVLYDDMKNPLDKAFLMIIDLIQDLTESDVNPDAYYCEENGVKDALLNSLWTTETDIVYDNIDEDTILNTGDIYELKVPAYIGKSEPKFENVGYDYTLWIDTSEDEEFDDASNLNLGEPWFIYKGKNYQNLVKLTGAYDENGQIKKPIVENLCKYIKVQEQDKSFAQDKIFTLNFNTHYYLHQRYKEKENSNINSVIAKQLEAIYNEANEADNNILKIFKTENENDSNIVWAKNMVEIINYWLYRGKTWKEIANILSNNNFPTFILLNTINHPYYNATNYKVNEKKLIYTYEVWNEYLNFERDKNAKNKDPEDETILYVDDYTYIPLDDIYEKQLSLTNITEFIDCILTYNVPQYYHLTKDYFQILETQEKLRDVKKDINDLDTFSIDEENINNQIEAYTKKANIYITNINNYYKNFINKLHQALLAQEGEVNE